MSGLITHMIFGISMGVFANVFHNYSHPNGSSQGCTLLFLA